MSSYPQQSWPFRALDTLRVSQQRDWLTHCYVRSGLDGVLLDAQRSVVIIAQPGSGLSTSMTLLQLQNPLKSPMNAEPISEPPSFLTFPYPPERWPALGHTSSQSSTHFELIMGAFADKCIETLKEQPEQLALIPLISHEFLIWLVRRYLPQRRGTVWLHTLEQHDPDLALRQVITQARNNELDQLYTDSDPQSIKGQIEECLDLAQCLGWQGVYAIADISLIDWINRTADERTALRDGMHDLLQQLTQLQRPRFGFKIGVPSVLLSQEDAQSLLRDRAEIITYAWSEDKLWQIADRMLVAASGQSMSLQELLPPGSGDELYADVYEIWGQMCPAAMAALARYAWEQHTLDIPQSQKVRAIRMKLYSNHAPLRRDPQLNQPIVWRGAKPLTLNQAQLRLFDFLWHQRGRFVQTEELIDLNIATSDDHLAKLVSRIRQVIEPLANAKMPVYLQRTPSQGIWLENCAFR